MTHADGLLVPEALDRLRRFSLESTIWYGYRYANGYVGAFIDDGFCCPLLLWSEQGHGDSIQFVRYADLAKRLGGRVVVERVRADLAVRAAEG